MREMNCGEFNSADFLQNEGLITFRQLFAPILKARLERLRLFLRIKN